MIYLAILLILTGLLIILVTLFLETRKVSAHIEKIKGNKSARGRNFSSEPEIFPDPENINIDLPDFPDDNYEMNYHFQDDEEDIFVSFDDSHENIDSYSDSPDFSGGENSVLFEDLSLMDTDESGSDEFFSDKLSEDKPAEAVMFEDRSGVIDYDSGEGIIDPGMAGYKKIKRVGRGELSLDMDGLNFSVDGRLYRFDFHRISKIFSGENYLAIPLRGGEAVRLFIFEKGDAFIEKISDYFYNSKKD
jgi:hypothetical protein